MKPRTFARRPSSIGSNQLSKSRSSASPVQAVVVLLVMAWSPVRRSNAGISRVANPGDYATPNSNHLRDGTVPSVQVLKIAVASCLSSSRRSLNTKALLNAGSMSTGPEMHQFCRLNAAAPGRADDSREGYAVRPDLCADSDCIRATSPAEIPLSRAVIELEAYRIASPARSIGVTHQRNVPAFAQGLP